MQKEQLMRLHQFFVYLAKEIIKDCENNDCKELLELYNKLEIKPHHIHRLKNEQKAAILLLSACISKCLEEEIDIPKNLSEKLKENALKYLNGVKR
ncbi:UPF0058 family protein [Methanocaldococcus infernus]|uniref:Uncharacterized protein n=1 Tax=Methanocaldococcus infernus (strain DSM 11812 / JCM 15783 / ME) TaxID=573063 RepID=D5VSN8_METIM|nr:UPF0058 family protein [Methanocaldococcus infernus]ADG13591.1 Protein of unknown function UPF0058 [Methanocaldococcus infernus ME]